MTLLPGVWTETSHLAETTHVLRVKNDVLEWLRARGVGYAIKVPFYRWLDLQQYIRRGPTWRHVAPDVSGFVVAAAATPWALLQAIQTLRFVPFHRAAALVYPGGTPTLRLANNRATRKRYTRIAHALARAA